MKKSLLLIVAAAAASLIMSSTAKAATINSTFAFDPMPVRYQYHAFLAPEYNNGSTPLSDEEFKQALIWLVEGNPQGEKYFNLKYFSREEMIAAYKEDVQYVFGTDRGNAPVTDDDLIALIKNTEFAPEPGNYYTSYAVEGITASAPHKGVYFKPDPNSASERKDKDHRLGFFNGKAWIKRTCANPAHDCYSEPPTDSGEVYEPGPGPATVRTNTVALPPTVIVNNNIAQPAQVVQQPVYVPVEVPQPQYQQPYYQPYQSPFLQADLSAGVSFGFGGGYGGGYGYGGYYGGGQQYCGGGPEYGNKNIYIDNSSTNNYVNSFNSYQSGDHRGGSGNPGGGPGNNNGGPYQGQTGGGTVTPSPGTDPNTGPGRRGNPFATINRTNFNSVPSNRGASTSYFASSSTTGSGLRGNQFANNRPTSVTANRSSFNNPSFANRPSITSNAPRMNPQGYAATRLQQNTMSYRGVPQPQMRPQMQAPRMQMSAAPRLGMMGGGGMARGFAGGFRGRR